MSNHAVMPLQDYIDTCEAIREKNGSTDAIKSGELASGVNEVFEAGKKSEYDAFWDAFQNYGKRTDYKYAFSYNSWYKNIFKPKYDIRPTGSGGEYLFANSGSISKFDLEEVLEQQGVTLDLSGLTSSACEFYMSRFTNLPTLDFSGCASMNRTFDYWLGTKLRLILSDSGETVFATIFRRCSQLANVVIERGTIGKTFNCADAPLSPESMKCIITHLKDYSGTDEEFTYKITFSSACLTALEAEGTTSPSGNTWTEYIEELGWLYS